MGPGVRIHGINAIHIGHLWSKYECFLISVCQDMDFWKTLMQLDGNGNLNGDIHDRGDYNSSLHFVKLG